jgi:hypothetical protein
VITLDTRDKICFHLLRSERLRGPSPSVHCLLIIRARVHVNDARAMDVRRRGPCPTSVTHRRCCRQSLVSSRSHRAQVLVDLFVYPRKVINQSQRTWPTHRHDCLRKRLLNNETDGNESSTSILMIGKLILSNAVVFPFSVFDWHTDCHIVSRRSIPAECAQSTCCRCLLKTYLLYRCSPRATTN